MMRRRRGPGLIGTAVVVGGASYMGTKMATSSAQKAEAQQQAAYDAGAAAAQQQAAAAQPAAPAQDDQMAELQKLATLHSQGILTDEEFAAAKAKALGI